jgi:hypothetical protein
VLSTGGKGKGVNPTYLERGWKAGKDKHLAPTYPGGMTRERHTLAPNPVPSGRHAPRLAPHTTPNHPSYPVYPLCVSPSLCQKGMPRPPANYLMPAAVAGLLRRAAPHEGAVPRVAAVTCPGQTVKQVVGREGCTPGPRRTI